MSDEAFEKWIYEEAGHLPNSLCEEPAAVNARHWMKKAWKEATRQAEARIKQEVLDACGISAIQNRIGVKSEQYNITTCIEATLALAKDSAEARIAVLEAALRESLSPHFYDKLAEALAAPRSKEES